MGNSRSTQDTESTVRVRIKRALSDSGVVHICDGGIYLDVPLDATGRDLLARIQGRAEFAVCDLVLFWTGEHVNDEYSVKESKVHPFLDARMFFVADSRTRHMGAFPYICDPRGHVPSTNRHPTDSDRKLTERDIECHSVIVKAAPTDRCPICFDGPERDIEFRMLPCFHKFHKECVDHWFLSGHSRCPSCKNELTNDGFDFGRGQK